VRLSTYIGANAGWFGTISDHPLHFYTKNSNPKVTLTQSGNLGVGTTNPLVKLHVNGPGIVEASVQSTNERAILSLNSTIGGQTRVWTLENGLFGTSGLFGIYDRNTSQARLSIQHLGPINMQGNTTQDLGSYGLPKAMLYVRWNGSSAEIARCYNAVTGLSASGCSFSVTFNSNNSTFVINLGFSVDNRFISITPVDTGGDEKRIRRQFYVANNTGGNLIYIHAENLEEGTSGDFGGSNPINIMVIVY
jgi:hypothetical protein